MRRFLILALAMVSVHGVHAAAMPEGDLYAGWLKMYDLKFDEAHRIFGGWKDNHPRDPLGPVSNAAAYLFSELARLGALESELFIDDTRFKERSKKKKKKKNCGPDPAKKRACSRSGDRRTGEGLSRMHRS